MTSAASWNAHLRAHLARLRAGRDPEALHQVRVAAARLRAGFELDGLRCLRGDLRWLRCSAARLRDLEVVLDQAQPESWAHWLEREREREHARFVALLDSPRIEGLQCALELELPSTARASQAVLRRRRKRALAAGRRLDEVDEPWEALHRLRRALRRLRYAHEALELDARPLERLQGELGALNDQVLALGFLRESGAAAALPAKERALVRDLEARRLRALRHWPAVRDWIEAS